MDDIELQLIDRERNCFRVYAICDGRTLFGELCLIVSWGRMGRVRTRTEIFDTPAALEARRTELLERRGRHGYRPVRGPDVA